jgi:hypothetical protein
MVMAAFASETQLAPLDAVLRAVQQHRWGPADDDLLVLAASFSEAPAAVRCSCHVPLPMNK